MDMHKPADALDYLQRSLKTTKKHHLLLFGHGSTQTGLMHWIIYNDENQRKSITSNRLDALDYLQRSLKIKKKASLHIDSDSNVARR